MHNCRTCGSPSARFALPLAFILGSIALGADANSITAEKLLTGLNNPHGVAVRPDGGESCEVFVAESGAGRVVKILADKPEKRIDVVSGFSTRPASEDRASTAGAHSLYFLDHMRLVVAGGDDDGAAFVRLYELVEPESPLTADQHKHEANVPEAGKEPDFDAHVLRSMARTQPNDRVGDFLLAAAPTDSEAAQLVYVPARSGTLGDVVPARFKSFDKVLEIGGIAVGKSGYVIISTNAPGDTSQPSQLAFFNPLDRRIVMQLPTDLGRIVALAYSPKSGNLFAANSPTTDDGRAGIYRLDAPRQPGTSACIAAKVADVGKPTAMAFAPDGTLYVTASGDPKSKNAGALLKLTGDL